LGDDEVCVTLSHQLLESSQNPERRRLTATLLLLLDASLLCWDKRADVLRVALAASASAAAAALCRSNLRLSLACLLMLMYSGRALMDSGLGSGTSTQNNGEGMS
jgi:hypothetical protein